MKSSNTCRGIVSAPHHLAAEAGAAVLGDGGNAVEAMVAAAATIAVVYPHMNSIGGDGFWLIAERGCAPVAISGCGPAAALATSGFYAAHGDSAIPTRGPRAALTMAGAVGGWAAALAYAANWGRALPLEQLLSDAIRHARDGVAVTRSQCELTQSKWNELASVPGFSETFAPDHATTGWPRAGDTQTQHQLAASLERLAHAGLDDFYRGDLASSMAHDLSAAGSPLRLADFESYRAQTVVPLSVDLRAGRVFNHPPPTQGVASLAILAIFERLGIHDADSFAHIHGLVEATKRAFRWRNAHLGDPRTMRADPASFLGAQSLEREAASIDMRVASPWPEAAERGDTVWLGAADSSGRVVSYIQSLYWEFGSGVVLKASGVQWQNRGASFKLSAAPNSPTALAPGRLPFHTLNPALAYLNDGRILAYGAMGGEGQPQTQAAIFTRHTDFRQDIQAAVDAPRWLLGRTWGAESSNLKIEPGFSDQVIAQLRAAGHELEVLQGLDDMMGHAGLVSLHADGTMEAAFDPRSDGGCRAA